MLKLSISLVGCILCLFVVISPVSAQDQATEGESVTYCYLPIMTNDNEQHVEFAPLGADNNYSGLADLMRKAGRSEEEIAASIEVAREYHRNLNLEGDVQASDTNVPNGQTFRNLQPNCPYGRSASAFGIAAQGQVYMWFQYVGGGTYNSKAFVCPYKEGCGWVHSGNWPWPDRNKQIDGHWLIYTFWGQHTSAYCN